MKKPQKESRYGHGPFSLLFPAMLTIFLVVVYTVIMQASFSNETLRAGIQSNTALSDSVNTTIMSEFTADELVGCIAEAGMQSEVYQTLQKRLNTLRSLKDIRYLYTAGRASDGTLVYLVDGLSQQAVDFAPPGTPIEK